MFIVFHIVVRRTIFSDLRKNYIQNRQSREILELIKQNNLSCEEPIFNHDIIPDFSGYCE
jgi:hypothetical protein